MLLGQVSKITWGQENLAALRLTRGRMFLLTEGGKKKNTSLSFLCKECPFTLFAPQPSSAHFLRLFINLQLPVLWRPSSVRFRCLGSKPPHRHTVANDTWPRLQSLLHNSSPRLPLSTFQLSASSSVQHRPDLNAAWCNSWPADCGKGEWQYWLPGRLEEACKFSLESSVRSSKKYDQTKIWL